jgi:hypothetical protein
MEIWIWIALASVVLVGLATLALVSFVVFLFSVLNEAEDTRDWYKDERW